MSLNHVSPGIGSAVESITDGDEDEYAEPSDGSEVPAGGDVGRWIGQDQAFNLLLNDLYTFRARKPNAVVFRMGA